MVSISTQKTDVKIAARSAFDIVKASGENILTYLQGQVTQDITKLSDAQALYAAILNPQGKVVTDFYLLKTAEKGSWAEVMLLCPTEKSLALVERLRMFAMGYELRIGKLSSWQLLSVQGQDADDFLKSQGLPIPHHKPLASVQSNQISILRMQESEYDGVWLMGTDIPFEPNADEAEMEKGRVLQGIPYLGVDWTEKLHPLNANLIERGGVSFDKGCYVGQEVTSRMQWRGGIKKKLYRVELDKTVGLPCPVLTTVKVGEITSLAENDEGQCVGIALLPIEVVDGGKQLSTEEGQTVNIIGICGE